MSLLAQIQIDLLDRINQLIINPILGLLFVLALAMFFYGLVEFIAGMDNEQKRTEGRRHMIWGILGLLIMVSVMGILNIICRTIGC